MGYFFQIEHKVLSFLSQCLSKIDNLKKGTGLDALNIFATGLQH